MFKKTYMKYVKKIFFKESLRALQVFLCALISRPVCVRTCAQLRGNVDRSPQFHTLFTCWSRL